jgi:hypothetical protein
MHLFSKRILSGKVLLNDVLLYVISCVTTTRENKVEEMYYDKNQKLHPLFERYLEQ